MLTHVIIIEVDEEQHKYYDTNCEITRINELFTDFGDRPIVFIRFNPDAYDNKKSCFKYHEQFGVPLINDKKDWENRLETFKKSIEKHIKTVPEETIFEYLFYDTI